VRGQHPQLKYESECPVNAVHGIRAILHEGLAFAAQGRFADALGRIDVGLADARALGDTKLTSLLARNAGIVCEDAGDPVRAERYYLSVSDDTKDPLLFLALARVAEKLGKDGSMHLHRAFDLASASGDQEALALLHKIGWPG
jgi:predicted Zn-dependent protease